MKKNLLNNYLTERLQSAEQNLSSYFIEQKPEFLHHLRVDIKKIRAAQYFAGYIYDEKFCAGKIRKLFKEAGRIREIQISIALLAILQNPPSALISQLKKKEKALTQTFIKNESGHLNGIRKFRKQIAFPETLAKKKLILEFFDAENSRIKKALQYADREGMHQYRSRIKKLMYVFNLLPERLQKIIELDKLATDKLQQKIGDWHDLHATIQFISEEYQSKKTESGLAELKNNETKQFSNLKRSLSIESNI
jgi:CHAD domain-containing protein